MSAPPPGYPPPYDAGIHAGPPPPGFQPQPQLYPQSATVHVVTQQPQQVVIVGSALGSHAARITCPHCRVDVETKIDKNPGLIAWISAGICCLVGCWLGCCLIPLCVDSCMDVNHKCPNCGNHLGTNRPF